MEYNIYCDESCHLLNDRQGIMVLGCVYCPREEYYEISENIRDLKEKHNLNRQLEVKWNKVSPGKSEFYEELTELFFATPNINFRAVVVPDKSILNHAAFSQTHDEWYYKMYYCLLKAIIDTENNYRIFLDFKDTWGGKRSRTLKEALRNYSKDYTETVIRDILIVNSKDSELIQLADLLIGAVAYKNRRLASSIAKSSIVKIIENRTHLDICGSVPLSLSKFNILIWQGREVE